MPTVVGFVESGCPFPVGFGGFFQTDPNSIYSGTAWEQKKDVFILAAGTTYPTGSTGGEAEHKLTVDEIAEHKHLFCNYTGGANPAKYGQWRNTTLSNTGAQIVPSGTTFSGVFTEPEGGSKPHNNMPPYFAMPFWIRTA